MSGNSEHTIGEYFEWADNAVFSWLETDNATGRCLYVIDYRKVRRKPTFPKLFSFSL